MNRISSRAVLFVAWSVFVLYAYPGYLDFEGVYALIDSRAGNYSGEGAPMLALVWRWVSIVLSGPPGMILLQGTLTLVGLYVVLRRSMPDRVAATLAAAVLLFPPVLATAARICIDSAQVAFLVAGIGLISADRRRTKLVGLAALVVATAMRPGGAAATLPIILVVFDCGYGGRRRQRVGIAIAAWLAVIAVGAAVLWVLVDRDVDGRAGTLAAVDVLGTAERLDAIDDADLAWAVFRAKAHQRSATDLLISARRDLVLSHTGEYLSHRAALFGRLLGFGPRGPQWQAVYTRIMPSRDARHMIRHSARHSVVQRKLNDAVTALDGTPLFWPFVYLAAAVVLLGVAILRRRHLEIAVLASGICHELSLAVVADAATFRSSHWLVVSTLLASAVAISRWWVARQAQNQGTNASSARQRD